MRLHPGRLPADKMVPGSVMAVEQAVAKLFLHAVRKKDT
jgi:hypothetical protein